MTIRSYGDIKLFAGSGCPALAQRIADYVSQQRVLQGDAPVALSDWQITNFPNENVWIQLGGSVRGQDVYVIQTHTRPVHRNLMEMLIAIDCLKRDSAGRITVVMPYLAYSQSDQKTKPRVPITARLVADMIEVAGADRWITIDLHAGQIQGFYRIPGDVLTARYIIVNYFKQKALQNAVIVTTDLGFAKDGRKFADDLGLDIAFVEKRRVGPDDTREALSMIGDVSGRDVIIVDDIVDTAGSIAQAVGVVKNHGALDVYLAFTHAQLSHPATDRLRGLPLKEIVTTDTLPIPSEKMLPNITVLSTAELLGDVILRCHDGRSVGELFDE